MLAKSHFQVRHAAQRRIPGKFAPPISGPVSDRLMRECSTRVTSGLVTGADMHNWIRLADKARSELICTMVAESIKCWEGVVQDGRVLRLSTDEARSCGPYNRQT